MDALQNPQAVARILLAEPDTDIRRRMAERLSRVAPLPEPREFFTSPRYGNMKSLWLNVLAVIERINDPRVREFYLELAKGSGKSSAAACSAVYAVARLCALGDPHDYFQLERIKPITCLVCSTNETQALDTIFAQVKTMIRRNPFFQHISTVLGVQPPKVLTNTVTFLQSKEWPDGAVNIICGHSKSEGLDGYDLFFAVIDEANKYGQSADTPTAQKLETTFRTSGESRFPSDYKLGMISSSVSRESYMRKIVDDILKHGEPVEAKTPSAK